MASIQIIVVYVALALILLQINQSHAKPTQAPNQEASNEVLETSPNYNDLNYFNTEQLLSFLIRKYKRNVDSNADYNQFYYDDGFVDPRRLKRYQRLSRGRIGGTIVMGKKR